MVRFVDGKPDKKGYRRFKIKSFAGNDDFRAMEEVVNRRYARLAQEGANSRIWWLLMVVWGRSLLQKKHSAS